MSTASGATGLPAPLRVAVVWNDAVHAERLFLAPEPIVLGGQSGGLCALPQASGIEGPLRLLDADAEGCYRLRLEPGLSGDVWLSGVRRAVSELGASGSSIGLGPTDFGVITIGPIAVFFQHSTPAARPRRRLFALDGETGAAIGLSAFLHVALLVLFHLARQEIPVRDTFELPPDLLARFLVVPPPDDIIEAMREPTRPTPQPEKREPTKVEKRPQKNRDPEPTRTETPAQMPESLRRALRDIENAREDAAGAAGSAVAALASPFASGGPSIREIARAGGQGTSTTPGFQVGSALAGLAGAGLGDIQMQGGGGGDIGTVGGSAASKGVGRVSGGGGGPVRGRVSSVKALAQVQGSLSQSAVFEVISAASGRIQRCYERALTRSPTLSGQIRFSWTIRPDGSVSGVREASSTLSDAEVSGCVSRILGALRYPQPQGGSVTVNYPFMFQLAR